MDDAQLTALGRWFGTHRMADHARLLRNFRRARARGGTSAWDDAQVLHWLRLARVIEHFPVIARLHGCPCGAERKWLYSVTSLPDGTLSRCRACGAEAIVVDADAYAVFFG